MSDSKPRYFVEKPQKGGTLYYWQPGKGLIAQGYKPVPLSRDRAEAIRQAEAINAKVDQQRGGQQVLAQNRHGTLPWLIEQYKQSVDYYKLRDSTKLTRKYDFARVLLWSASLRDPPLRTITKLNANTLWKQIHVDEGYPTTATRIIKLCSTLWTWALDADLDIVASNPFRKLKLDPLPPRDEVWQPGQIADVVETALATYRQSIALAIIIAKNTCQRESDVLAMRWSQFDGKYLKVTQEKTGATVTIPVTAELKYWLDDALRARSEAKVVSLADATDGQIVVNEATGRRWHKGNFQVRFRKICRAAGIPDDLQFRDLRRTGTTVLAEAGCSHPEIASIGGWKQHTVAKMMEVYGKANVTMADNAILKLEAYRKRQLAGPRSNPRR
jgi:integrase